MPILGAHMSIAGGYYKAVDAAAKLEMDCVQIFTKNNNQWRAKEITDEQAEAFREAVERTGMRATVAHASYLINLASPDDELWEKSIAAMRVELRRAERLGVPHVILHPGAFTSSDEQSGIARVCSALNQIYEAEPDCAVLTLLETTAGQGTCLGWKFEHLAEMLKGVDVPHRIGFCLDTCHVLAAGYPLGSPEEYEETVSQFDQLLGISRLYAIHLNDSKKPLGSRVDRHEHIGDGELGLEPFRLLLNDARFAEIPMYLETAKEDAPDGRSWDEVNLERLRTLVDG